MIDREHIIQAAVDAAWDARRRGIGGQIVLNPPPDLYNMIRAAYVVFEKAHTPTDDESWLNNLSYAATTLEASADNGDRYCARLIREHLAAKGFRNSETPEPRIEQLTISALEFRPMEEAVDTDEFFNDDFPHGHPEIDAALQAVKALPETDPRKQARLPLDQECPQPCEHLSQEDAREGRTCSEHPCTCEPSDTEVTAALDAYLDGAEEVDWQRDAMRAALRAARSTR